MTMWKESYRMGVELIDKQHMELFKMVEHLVSVLRSNKCDKKKECIDAILYMKDYTLRHFSDEEAYQKLIGYSGYEEHKKIHQKFVQKVLDHEKKMVNSDFDEKDIKDFAGTLIAWLVYHVAGTDQQIVAEKKKEDKNKRRSPIDSYFHISTCDILNKLTGLDIKNMKVVDKVASDAETTIVVKVNFKGDASGTVTYKYTKQLAFDLIQNMAFITPKTIDELVCSAMLEISNIISVKALGMLSTYGFSCKMDTPVMQIAPAFFPSDESIIFDTGMGVLEMNVSIQ